MMSRFKDLTQVLDTKGEVGSILSGSVHAIVLTEGSKDVQMCCLYGLLVL